MTSATEAPNIKVHANPIWRSRANFIVAIKLDEVGFREQLWARQVADRRFELCCIPFFAYDLALGDVVETDDSFTIRKVVKPSGRYVFRAWFGEAGGSHADIVEALERVGAQTESYSTNLIAIDAADAHHAQLVADLLLRHETQHRLIYETGKKAITSTRDRFTTALNKIWRSI